MKDVVISAAFAALSYSNFVNVGGITGFLSGVTIALLSFGFLVRPKYNNVKIN